MQKQKAMQALRLIYPEAPAPVRRAQILWSVDSIYVIYVILQPAWQLAVRAISAALASMRIASRVERFSTGLISNGGSYSSQALALEMQRRLRLVTKLVFQTRIFKYRDAKSTGYVFAGRSQICCSTDRHFPGPPTYFIFRPFQRIV